MRREIRKSIKWRPGPQKNNQRGPKNNQKWSKTIPKSAKMAFPQAAPRPPSAAPFLCFLGLFLTIFDCFLVLFGCFFGAQASILWIFLFRAPFFDCFWWFLIVFWLFFVIFIGLALVSDFIDFGPFFDWLIDCFGSGPLARQNHHGIKALRAMSEDMAAHWSGLLDIFDFSLMHTMERGLR